MEITTLENVLAHMRTYTERMGTADATSIMNYFDMTVDSGIKVHFAVTQPSARPGRGRYGPLCNGGRANLILSPDRQYDGPKTAVHRAANGVVISYPEWRVIAMPPPILETQYSVKDLNLDDYDAYEAIDGTAVNMYFFGGRWIPATCNAIDASRHTWMGASTYDSVLKELIPQSTFAKMKKNRSYTFVFRHPDFHPFGRDTKRIVFIQSADCSGMFPKDITRDDDIGIAPCPRATVDFAAAESALENILKDTTSKPCYGYALRRKDTSKGFDCLVDSSLMNYIRKSVCDFSMAREPANTPNARIDFITMRAFLIPEFNTNFLQLFPQFTQHFASHRKMMQVIQERIIARIGNPAAKPPVGVIDQIAAVHVAALAPQNININSAQTSSIVSDYVRDPMHLDRYCHAIADNRARTTK